MASTLAAGGLVSGIDTKAIVDAFLNSDRAPARLAETNKAVAQTRLDAIKAMNTRLLALSDAMDAIEQKTAFDSAKATSSNESILTASASTSAIAGGMTINVKQLAAAHQVAAAGRSSATADLGAGTIVLRLASTVGADITVTPTSNTLEGMASAINAAKAGVTASVINDGSGSPYRLVVTSDKTGVANAITKLNGTGGFATVLPSLGGLSTVTAAADAQVRLGNATTGMLLSSATNSMDQAIPGVTLNLKAVGDGVNVAVSQDAAAIRGTVQKLADTFNAGLTYLRSNSKYDTATKKAGALFSEYDLRSQMDAIERELSKSFSSQPTGFKNLADIGVTFAGDGQMKIDATIFDAKLAENKGAVASLFLAAGAAGSTPLESLTRSSTGSMALKQSSLQSSIDAYNDRIARVDARLETRRTYYERKFLAMEKLMAQFQSQGSSITNLVNSFKTSNK